MNRLLSWQQLKTQKWWKNNNSRGFRFNILDYWTASQKSRKQSVNSETFKKWYETESMPELTVTIRRCVFAEGTSIWFLCELLLVIFLESGMQLEWMPISSDQVIKSLFGEDYLLFRDLEENLWFLSESFLVIFYL